MRVFSIFLLFLTLTAQGQVDQILAQDFKNLLIQNGIGPLSEQSFCYRDFSGIRGHQIEKLQRIASVTKILTTYFASETLDLNQRFETKIFISGDRLHIQGGRDPYFEKEKLLLLMSALNSLGYKSFKTITFDNDFIFYDLPQSDHFDVTPLHTKQRLVAYLNNKSSKLIKSKWAEIEKFAAEEDISLEKRFLPEIHVENILPSQINPLKDLKPEIYVHRSLPLHSILKSMNVMSKNLVAQNIYLEASRVRKFESVMNQLGIGKKAYQIHNGSGLPVKNADLRKDNLATCHMIIQILDNLEQSIKKHHLYLSDVMAVSGKKDLGSFRNRFEEYPETFLGVISKTGTVVNTSSLAGMIHANGLVPFAILNHTSHIVGARKFQDSFVAKMLYHLSTSHSAKTYDKISIFPWDGLDFLELGH